MTSLRAERKHGLRLWTDPDARRQGVLVAFNDRTGGVSKPPYDTLNLARWTWVPPGYPGRGRLPSDAPEAVSENRRRAAAAAGFDVSTVATARQVHGTKVIAVGTGQRGLVGEADGLVVSEPGAVVQILTADCAAVAIAGERGIALVHAGWRGLVGGIVERGVRAVAPAWGAWIGPAIRSCCYRVGPEVMRAWDRAGLPVTDDSHVDISTGVDSELRRAGVSEVAAVGDCTCCNPSYFSHRRDRITGRQGAFAGLL